LENGSYDVLIGSGPSYASLRQEAFGTYSQMAMADPKLMQVAGDIVFRNLDAPGADVIADRYEKTLPPEFSKPAEGKQPIPPQIQQLMEAGKSQIMALSETVHKLQDELDSKKPEIESRLKIAEMQEETKRIQIQAQIEIAKASEGLRSEAIHLKEHMAAIRDSRDFALSAHQQMVENATEEVEPTEPAQTEEPTAAPEVAGAPQQE
jgi:hypothetical protein